MNTPKEGFVLTHFLTVADVERSEFYLRIFGGKIIRSGEPTIIRIANSWIVLNVGGGPTDGAMRPVHQAQIGLLSINSILILNEYRFDWRILLCSFLKA